MPTFDAERLSRLRDIHKDATAALRPAQALLGQVDGLLKNLDRQFLELLELGEQENLDEAARLAFDLKEKMLLFEGAFNALSEIVFQALTPPVGEDEPDLDWLIADEAERRRQAEEAARDTRR